MRPLACRMRKANMRGILAIIFLALASLSAVATTLDRVTLGLNWLADAEAGGFYQALADGTYAKYGLDVTIKPGGPQTNGALFLILGKIEFYVGGDLIGDFVSTDRNLPSIIVAAEFQKDPQAFLSHPGVGLDRWADLPRATAFVSQTGINSFYAWMCAVWGFSNDKIKPYLFNSGPFISDPKSIQQAYVTSEPFEIEKQGGFRPNVFMLYDRGLRGYATTIETRRDLVENNPDLVQRFVDASAIGWYHYLYGDHSKGDAIIRRENPEMTDEQIVYSRAKLREYGIVDSGDSLALGIGAMTDARMREFFNQLVRARMVRPDADYRRAYTLRFVNKRVGVGSAPK